jgi:hypothetical protein
VNAPTPVSRSRALRYLAGGAIGLFAQRCGVVSALACAVPPHPREVCGPPNLRTLLALVLAGGGPGDFRGLTLIGVLAAPNANAAVVRLVQAFGAREVKAFIVSLDFFVADALRGLKQNGLALPATPDPDPKDGKALAAALRAAGVEATTNTYCVECMLDRLVSPRLHHRITSDIEAKFGAGAGAAFAAIFVALMTNLQTRTRA